MKAIGLGIFSVRGVHKNFFALSSASEVFVS